MGEPDIPDECMRGNHDFGQGGRCLECHCLRDGGPRTWGERRSGGAGSLRHPTTNREYREQIRKLLR